MSVQLHQSYITWGFNTLQYPKPRLFVYTEQPYTPKQYLKLETLKATHAKLLQLYRPLTC